MLNLRQLNTETTLEGSTAAEHFSRFSSPHFRVPSNFVGNMGEPLDFGESLQPEGSEWAEYSAGGGSEVDISFERRRGSDSTGSTDTPVDTPTNGEFKEYSGLQVC